MPLSVKMRAATQIAAETAAACTDSPPRYAAVYTPTGMIAAKSTVTATRVSSPGQSRRAVSPANTTHAKPASIETSR